MVNGDVSVIPMVEVRIRCGICGRKASICLLCYPDIRSAQQLHRETPAGFYAHCGNCHDVIVDDCACSSSGEQAEVTFVVSSVVSCGCERDSESKGCLQYTTTGLRLAPRYLCL